jgi:hypothetical protein
LQFTITDAHDRIRKSAASPHAIGAGKRIYLIRLGAVTKLTIQIALDGFLRSRKKTQPYRGAARPVDERLAPTGAKRRPARLSDEEIGKPDKQDV